MSEPSSHSHGDDFTADEQERYLRHFALPQFGRSGQEKLRNASVLVVGAGGLGCPASLYLAAAGVGKIGIIDADTVETSNLQRQILHQTRDVGRPKTASASEHLLAMNPLIEVEVHPSRLSIDNALDIIQSYDMVLDGSDNFPTRYLINDACHFLDKPWIYGSVFRFEGQVSVFCNQGPCYRCLYPEPPDPGLAPDCSQAGVLGVLPGVIGTVQATEAIKILSGIGQPLIGHVFYYDALNMTVRKLGLPKDTDCPLCGSNPSIRELTSERTSAACETAGTGLLTDEISAEELKNRLESNSPPILVDIREPWEHALCDITGSTLIPMNELQERMDELPADQNVVLFCRSGVRTRHVLDNLPGLPPKTVHLKGGILSWSDKIDPSVPKY